MTARNDFDGTMLPFITTTGTIADGVFSVDSTNATITEFDNTGVSDKWTSLMLVLTGNMAADPGDNTTIGIYRFETEIDGTSGHDETAPEVGKKNGAKSVGSFIVPDGTSVFYSRATVSMIGIKKCKLALLNSAGVSLASGATVKLEAFGFDDS